MQISTNNNETNFGFGNTHNLFCIGDFFPIMKIVVEKNDRFLAYIVFLVGRVFV